MWLDLFAENSVSCTHSDVCDKTVKRKDERRLKYQCARQIGGVVVGVRVQVSVPNSPSSIKCFSPIVLVAKFI